MVGKKTSHPTMMRIAIAGAGGFAYILAQEISQGANAVLVLSNKASVNAVRRRQPLGCFANQVAG